MFSRTPKQKSCGDPRFVTRRLAVLSSRVWLFNFIFPVKMEGTSWELEIQTDFHKLAVDLKPYNVILCADGTISLTKMLFSKIFPFERWTNDSNAPCQPGPFKINSVPLRRVNPTYVLATSTKVDISRVSLEKYDDKYFAKHAEKKNG